MKIIQKTIVIILVISCIFVFLIGVRNFLLTKIDCKTCRVYASLLFRPYDWNRPIAMSKTSGGSSVIYLFPKYVAPYSVQIYGDNMEEVDLNNLNIKCSEGVESGYIKQKSNNREVVSVYGRGLIVEYIKLFSEHVSGKTIPYCELNLPDKHDFYIVVSRFSEF